MEGREDADLHHELICRSLPLEISNLELKGAIIRAQGVVGRPHQHTIKVIHKLAGIATAIIGDPGCIITDILSSDPIPANLLTPARSGGQVELIQRQALSADHIISYRVHETLGAGHGAGVAGAAIEVSEGDATIAGCPICALLAVHDTAVTGVDGPVQKVPRVAGFTVVVLVFGTGCAQVETRDAAWTGNNTISLHALQTDVEVGGAILAFSYSARGTDIERIVSVA